MENNSDFSKHMRNLINRSRLSDDDKEEKNNHFSSNNTPNINEDSMTKVCMTYDLIYINRNGKKEKMNTDVCSEPGYHKNADLDELDLEISTKIDIKKKKHKENRKKIRKVFNINNISEQT